MLQKSLQTSLFEWLRGGSGRQGVLQISTDEESEMELATILHSMLEDRVGRVDLVITDNRRRMVSVKRTRGRTEFRVHRMFLGCDDGVVDALVGLGVKDTASRKLIRSYVEENRDAIVEDSRDVVIRTDGEHFDLAALLVDVRQRLAESQDLQDIQITWGRKGSGKRSIRFGSYNFDLRLIRIHPSLDAAWVPKYFVEFVIYHELLHALFPPDPDAKRRVLHPPEFREREQCFERYDDAMAWEEANLKRLLR